MNINKRVESTSQFLVDEFNSFKKRRLAMLEKTGPRIVPQLGLGIHIKKIDRYLIPSAIVKFMRSSRGVMGLIAEQRQLAEHGSKAEMSMWQNAYLGASLLLDTISGAFDTQTHNLIIDPLGGRLVRQVITQYEEAYQQDFSSQKAPEVVYYGRAGILFTADYYQTIDTIVQNRFPKLLLNPDTLR